MDEEVKECTNNEGWSLVADEEIESFLQELSKNWPGSLQICNFIKCSLTWNTYYPQMKSAIYRKLSKGLVSVIATLKTNEHIVTAYCSNGPDLDTASVISGNELINWSEGSQPVLFSCIPKELSPFILEAMTLSGKKVIRKHYNSFWLPEETAKTIEVQCPEDMYLSKLNPRHAEMVTRHWPYARKETLHIIAQMINALDTVGIFTKKDSTLVSWVMNTYYGVGMLHTIEEYRRKGYATIVVQQLVKTLGEKGIISYLSTHPDNHSAETLFMNLGFKHLEEVEFLRVV